MRLKRMFRHQPGEIPNMQRRSKQQQVSLDRFSLTLRQQNRFILQTTTSLTSGPGVGEQYVTQQRKIARKLQEVTDEGITR